MDNDVYRRVRKFFARNNRFTGINTFTKPLELINSQFPNYNSKNIGFEISQNSSIENLNTCNKLCQLILPCYGLWFIEFYIILECNTTLSIISQDCVEIISRDFKVKEYHNIIPRTNNTKCTISQCFIHCGKEQSLELSLFLKISCLRRDRNIEISIKNESYVLKATRIS